MNSSLEAFLSNPSDVLFYLKMQLGSLFVSCIVAAVLGFGLLCHCCIPGPSNASSEMPVLSGFLVPYCPGRMSCDRVPCAVPFLYFGSSSCQLWPIPSTVQNSLKTFTLHREIAAQWATFLQATANFLRDTQSPWVSSLGSPRRPAAECQSLCCFFIVPDDLTAVSSIGTS
jgi:hypothetical protein